MAKANFHKNQRVYVKPVGTWALVEKVLPQWVKGLEEPLKIHYDVGLGREFSAAELTAEKSDSDDSTQIFEHWRVMREKNRWQDEESASDHPFPGTFPRVVTDEKDWGGWRVPNAEYQRDPHKIEFQALVIAAAPQLLKMAKMLSKTVSQSPEDYPPEMIVLAKQCRAMLLEVYSTNSNDAPKKAAE